MTAQTNTITGKVTNEKGMPLQHAVIECKDQRLRTTTDETGKFVIQLKIPATISVQLLGYLTVEEGIRHTETQPIKIILKSNTFSLPTVDINSKGEPVLIESDLRLKDFEINNNELWYLYAFKKGHRIKVENLKTSATQNYKFRTRSNSINKSAHDFIYLQTDDSIYFVGHDTILLNFYSLSNEKFKSNVETLAAYNRPTYYYKSEGAISQQTLFYSFNSNDSKMNCFYKYINLPHGKRNLEEALNFGIEVKSREDAPKSIDRINPPTQIKQAEDNSAMRRAEANLDFYNNILFTPLICELKIYQDSLFVFNFDNDTISVFDLQCNYSRSLKLDFNKQEVHERKIVVDENKKTIYFSFIDNGILNLNEIDPHTGKTIRTSKISGFAFPKKCRIYNKEAYFIVWDKFEDTGKLFKQKL